MTVEDLRQSPMMGHMLDALDNGEDIGHYGRLVFAMIGRHFVSSDERFSHRMRRGRSFVGRCPTNPLLQSTHPRAVASLEAVDAARRAT